VIVLAKAPVPGQVKTRLIPVLGPEGAAALAARMLAHAVQAAVDAEVGSVELCLAPDARAPEAESALDTLRTPAVSPLERTAQGDGDLGARMARALDRGLARDLRVLMIGTDCPALDATVLRAAATALETHDAVLGPALDGGYVLIGARVSLPFVFADMPWSTDRVLDLTRSRLAAHRICWAELPPMRDVDEPDDLVGLPAGWL
jgi:rSAM/selenodomain-associated transferase 1